MASFVNIAFALLLTSHGCLLSSAFAVPGFSSIINHQDNHGQKSQIPHFMSTSSASSAARDLLYQDQQQAMLRRALVEEELLSSRTSLLEAPANLKTKGAVQSGTGFGGGKAVAAANQGSALAQQQAKILKRDGVIRIANVLTPEMADNLRAFVLEQQILASQATQQNPSLARSFYGVEQARAHRCDLQLSLLRGGYAADTNTDNNLDVAGGHVLSDALQEVLGSQGTLRPLYEKLVTKEGEFYELAAVITDPGSNRQIIHPDLPYQAKAPLYVVFVALQDVTELMGPTSFLLGTHTKSQNDIFSSGSVAEKNDQLAAADCRLSCLPKGHAVVFDARLLHCGNANTSDQTRAMWNFSFRNPAVTGDLGYKGSIRPGYCEAMTLADVGAALEAYQNGNPDPFARYGSGLL